MKQEIERFVGKKLGRQRSGPSGKAQAIERHPDYGFARREDFLCMGHEACVDHVNQPYVADDSGDHASMIEAFEAKWFHGSILP